MRQPSNQSKISIPKKKLHRGMIIRPKSGCFSSISQNFFFLDLLQQQAFAIHKFCSILHDTLLCILENTSLLLAPLRSCPALSSQPCPSLCLCGCMCSSYSISPWNQLLTDLFLCPWSTDHFIFFLVFLTPRIELGPTQREHLNINSGCPDEAGQNLDVCKLFVMHRFSKLLLLLKMCKVSLDNKGNQGYENI